MEGHEVRYSNSRSGARAYCNCGESSVALPNKQDAEEWHLRHLSGVRAERARRKGPPSLKSQRDYYLAQAESATQSDDDRRLWRSLADELTRRLEPPVTSEDQPLF